MYLPYNRYDEIPNVHFFQHGTDTSRMGCVIANSGANFCENNRPERVDSTVVCLPSPTSGKCTLFVSEALSVICDLNHTLYTSIRDVAGDCAV